MAPTGSIHLSHVFTFSCFSSQWAEVSWQSLSTLGAATDEGKSHLWISFLLFIIFHHSLLALWLFHPSCWSVAQSIQHRKSTLAHCFLNGSANWLWILDALWGTDILSRVGLKLTPVTHSVWLDGWIWGGWSWCWNQINQQKHKNYQTTVQHKTPPTGHAQMKLCCPIHGAHSC